MSTINKVILIGNLGDDPEVNYLDGSGICVANCSLATTENWKDKEGNKQSKTEWHRIVFFRKLGEIVEKYVKKGHKIYVEGKLQTRKWEDKDGNAKYTTEVVADKMTMLTSQGGDGSQRRATSQAESHIPVAQGAGDLPDGNDGGFDDLPF